MRIEALTEAVERLARAHKLLGAEYGERDEATTLAYQAWEIAERRLTAAEKEQA